MKTFSDRFQNEEVPPPIEIPVPPFPTAQTAPADLLQEGKLVYRVLQCWTCHGMAGKGDGPSASALVDDFEVPIRPFDFTTGNFKFGDSPADVYRTFNTGLNGTPMPSFYDTILYPREAFPDSEAVAADLQREADLQRGGRPGDRRLHRQACRRRRTSDKMSDADKSGVRRPAAVGARLLRAVARSERRPEPRSPSTAGFRVAQMSAMAVADRFFRLVELVFTAYAVPALLVPLVWLVRRLFGPSAGITLPETADRA